MRRQGGGRHVSGHGGAQGGTPCRVTGLPRSAGSRGCHASPMQSQPANACQWLPISDRSSTHSLYCAGARGQGRRGKACHQPQCWAAARKQGCGVATPPPGDAVPPPPTLSYGRSRGSRWVSFRLGGKVSSAAPSAAVPARVHCFECSGVSGCGVAHSGHRMAAEGRSTSTWPCTGWQQRRETERR